MRKQSKQIAGRLLMAGLLGSALLSATAAQASYTAIDQVPVLDSHGNPVFDSFGNIETHPFIETFGGYCDTENSFQNSVGQGCGAPLPFSGRDNGGVYTLPYKVTFGPGETTNQILLLDSGQIEFIGDPLANPVPNADSTLDPTQYYNVLQTFDTGIAGNPGSFAPQLASLSLHGSSIDATWFTCANPVRSCHVDLHTAILKPGADGFNISYTGGSGPDAPVFLAATFDPAQSSGTPEPGVWALLIVGFGAVGAVLRRRRAEAASRRRWRRSR
jgi:hypothetical protein